MAPIVYLFSSIALFVAAAQASPIDLEARQTPAVVEVPVSQVISTNATTAKMVRADRTRIDGFKAATFGTAAAAGQTTVAVRNDIVSYIASVGVGASNKQFQLIVDTGSSNTWVGARGGYTPTSTSTNTLRPVSVTYGSGSFTGLEYADTVTFGVPVTKQGLGVALTSSGFTDVDGIIGFGPEDLTSGTVVLSGQVPTFMQNAAAQKKIPANILGVYFAPTTVNNTANGRLSLGGVNSAYYTGSITYGPITSTSPASQYWGINVAFAAGGATLISNDAGIVDTGTTLTYLATNVAAAYFAGSGFTLDSSSGLYRSTSASGAKALNVVFAGTTFTWKAADTLVPSGLYPVFGLSSGYYYSWINDIGSNSGSGLDFILGMKFLEHFYSVFDTANSRVGLANTNNA